MKIDGTVFGAITIDGKTYEHDVVVRLSGEVVKRKKKLSKKLYGTSHVLSEDEAKFLFEKGCDQVVIGSGQMGNVHLSPEAEAYLERKGCWRANVSCRRASMSRSRSSGLKGIRDTPALPRTRRENRICS